ncbi:MAG: TRAP transporter small permease [Pusillimonas sp.]
MKQVLFGLDRALAYLRSAALVLAGIGLFFIAVICTADVIAYVIMRKPFPGVSETVEVALAVTVVMTLAYTQHRKEHVCVDILLVRMSPFWLKVSGFISYIVSLFCMVILAWRAWVLAIESVSALEVSATVHAFPIYPWKILFALGITLAALEVLRQLLHFPSGDDETIPVNSGHNEQGL